MFKASRAIARVAFAVAMSAGFSSMAQAQTINFDDLIGRNNFFDAGIAGSYQGFRWGTSLYGTQSSQTGWAYGSSGSITNSFDPTPSSTPTIAWTWNGPQSLFIDFLTPTSVTGAMVASLYPPNSHGSNTLQMFGYDGGGNLIASSGVLNLTNSMQQLSAGFVGVNAVEFRSDRTYSWFVVDDIELNAVVATPEPASMVLLATGLIGVAGFARRRRNT